MSDEIKVHKDKKLLELEKQWMDLESEKVTLYLGKQERNEKGRTTKDIAKDMVEVYRLTNEHLKNLYPNNEVAKSWIAVNEFSSHIVSETWL